ncbi:MAG: replicative DNA helicase [Rickettsiales bacterium]|jgi:replicative DNA helicase
MEHNLSVENIATEPVKSINKRELYHLEAEQIILGTIILNNDYLNRVSEFLLSEHFYEPAHQKIYSEILHIVSDMNIIANNVTLKQFFSESTEISGIGGMKYMAVLMDKATGIVDIADYAKLIYDLYLKRNLTMIAEDIIINCNDLDDQTALEKIENAEREIFNLTFAQNSGSDFRGISEALKTTLEKTLIAKQTDSNITGVSTGLADFDHILSGLQDSDLIIIAGRPSMGKTALAINVAVNACKDLIKKDEEKEEKRAVGIFSLEMSSDQLSSRILSMETSINATKFRSGAISEDEWQVISARSAEIAEMPIFIDDTPALSISAIRTRTRRLVKKKNLSLLIIDYLQLIRGSKKTENRVQEITEITQGLKAIAKEFNIPVIALSQLSRAVEQRDDKRPQLSDLRESGSIEQDADVVTFIYRESYYLERKRPDESEVESFKNWQDKMNEIRNKSEVIIAKQRNGPVGSVELFFDAEFTRFANWGG